MFSFGARRALEKTLEKARQVIGQLEERIRALLKEAQSLREENKKLREELAQKERRGKRQAAPFSRDNPKADPKKPGRKPGSRYGRQGKRPPPSHVDRVVEASLPSQCPDCGGAVVEDGVDDQFQTDIPPVVPVVTHFRIHVGRCTDCGQGVRGRHAEQTSDAVGAAAQQIGPKALATASHMHTVLGISYGKVTDLFERCFGLELVPSTLVRAQRRLGTQGEGVYDELKQAVRQAPFVYPDETGWRLAGASAWLWVFVTRWVTVYTINRSRGRDVIEDILGCDYAGAVGHDGWGPYGCLVKAVHQTCLAHLLRRCDELLEAATRGAVRFPRAAQSLLLDALALRDRRDAGLISHHGLLSAIGKLEARRDDLLEWSPSYEPNRLLRNHLDRVSDELFPFLRIPGLEATNWPAEQAIRPAVVNRKVCGGNRNETGSIALARLMTIFRTAQQQNRDGVAFLIELMRTPPGHALPSLMPAP
jgi:transposase